MLAISEDDIKAMLDLFIEDEMPNKDAQRVYENGFENLKLTRKNATTYEITSVGHYGPKFEISDLKKEITADKVGQARSYLQDLPGVKGVDINLSPFWARQIPNEGRITIKLEVDKNISG